MSPHSKDIDKSDKKMLNIAVRGFAKVSVEGENVFERVDKSGNECNQEFHDEPYLCDMVNDETEHDDDVMDEPVSPPACGEDKYPRLILSGDSEYRYSKQTSTMKSLNITQAKQQKILQLKSQLLKLSPTNLKELNTALKDHIRRVQEKTNLEKLAVESLLSMKTGQILEQSEDKEGSGNQNYPDLIPLTISEIDQKPRQNVSNPAMTFPTVHMSGGLVTMAGITSDKHKLIDCSESNSVKASLEHQVCGEDIASKQKANLKSTDCSINSGKALHKIPPYDHPLIVEDKTLKRKSDELPVVDCSKKCKVEVAEEITEESAKIGISTLNKQRTNLINSNYKAEKSKPNLSEIPLKGLEQFILDLLHSLKSNSKIISWENVDEGVFRITNLETFFQVWRNIKNVPITYQLFKKSIKLLEENKTLIKMPKMRSVYKFGRNTKNWKIKKDECIAGSYNKPFETFECKLKFAAPDTERAVLTIENRFCVEIDRKVFLQLKKKIERRTQ